MTELTRRTFLQTAPAAAVSKRTRRRPNLLYLIADDHAGYALGCDGHKLAETPNLDRLASEGRRYAQNYCNSPVCTPSRQSFLTGLLPHAAGVTTLRTPLSESHDTVAKRLKRAGYSTAVFGKMHFNQPGRPGLHGFDYLMTEPEWQRAWTQASKPVITGAGARPPWRPFRDPARIWLNADKLPSGYDDAGSKGTFLANRAMEYLDSRKGRAEQGEPFALWVSFTEPHSPFDFPVEDTKRYQPAQFPVPRVGPEDAWQVPLIFRELSDGDKQGINAAYYTSVRYLDRNIGRVLAHLDKLGLADNTLVVYMADHGYCLGHHGRFEKHCSYDPAQRVPLIMRHPGSISKEVVTNMTESVDVPPTILDELGVEPFARQHGRSLKGRVPARDFIFNEYLENEEASLRTNQYKFVFSSGKRERQDGYKTDNPKPGRWRRLYDLRADAGEFTNIAAREPKIADNLERQLLEIFRTTHPEAAQEPQRLAQAEALEWYLRPRDDAGPAEKAP